MNCSNKFYFSSLNECKRNGIITEQCPDNHTCSCVVEHSLKPLFAPNKQSCPLDKHCSESFCGVLKYPLHGLTQHGRNNSLFFYGFCDCLENVLLRQQHTCSTMLMLKMISSLPFGPVCGQITFSLQPNHVTVRVEALLGGLSPVYLGCTHCGD